MLTPDRVEGVRGLHRIARTVLGTSLKSASVSVEYSYDEPVPPVLVFAIVADVDRQEWSRARKAITKAQVEMEWSWPDEKREDWQKSVYFSLFPLKI